MNTVHLFLIGIATFALGSLRAEVLTGPITNAANGHWYFLLSPTNWPSAEAEAVNLGGHLATIDDEDENAWVTNAFSNFGGVARRLWIGLNDSDQEGTWVWVSGDPAPYQNWAAGEPNNGGGAFPEEDHVSMLPPGHPEIGMWNDAPSNFIYSAVVELVTPIPPSIVSQPQAQTVLAGETAAFSVIATGTIPFTYQWLLNGTNISGATASSLTLTNAQFADAGNYSVVVANVVGTNTSSDALLTVNPPPPCAAPPTGLLSWWPGSGTTTDVADGNSGILAGNAAFAPGKVGPAFAFDGNRDGVQFGMATNLQLQDFSIETWIKRASDSAVSFNGNGSGMILSLGGGGGGYAFYVKVDGTLAFGKLQVNEVVAGAQITDTNWHHVAVTKLSTNVSFYVDGVTYPAPAYDSGGFTFSAAGYLGAWLNPAAQVDNSFYGMIDEPAVYNRDLTAAEIQEIHTAGLSGKCPYSVPPVIVIQPRNTNVTAGSNVTLTVLAGGSEPFSYQWRFNATNLIAGATNAALTLTNVQFSHIGDYSVQVTNIAGLVISSEARLTVAFPSAVVRALNTNAMGGAPVIVPVSLAANGNENAFGFSLNFSTQRLAFASVALGSGAAGATLLVNTSLIATGRLGIVVAFPQQETFVPGTQQVVRVTFNSFPVLGATPVPVTIAFADQPVLRELVDPQLQPLSAIYANGIITLAPTVFEADVFPRTNGNQNVSTTDWLQVGRFVARLDTPVTTNEFQRADSAPRALLGDGQMKVTDWVQAGRYVAGFDPRVAVGGPTAETAPTIAGPSASRQLRVLGPDAIQGQPAQISVSLEAQGDENALGFTLTFDPANFTFASATLGSSGAGANMTVNSSQPGSGRLGIILTLPTGSTFSAGTKDLVKVNLVASSPGTFPLTLTDQVVTRCISDAVANELPVSYVNGTVTVVTANANPVLEITVSGTNAILSWPSWAADFTLQTLETTNGLQGGWTNIPSPLQTNGSAVSVTLPIANQSQIFRLRHP